MYIYINLYRYAIHVYIYVSQHTHTINMYANSNSEKKIESFVNFVAKNPNKTSDVTSESMVAPRCLGCLGRSGRGFEICRTFRQRMSCHGFQGSFNFPFFVWDQMIKTMQIYDHFGGICRYNIALFGLVSYNDPVEFCFFLR